MFDNFVSLGPACPTASSMAKYGLRSWSGVFDWLIIPEFKNVLYFMETDFENFMEMDNLEILPNNPTMFKDKKYNIIFVHDQEYPLFTKYDSLLEKYRNKVQKFMTETSKKTCFLRFITNEKEVQYISEHKNYIYSVIKKNNKENSIIFLVEKDFGYSEIQGFQYYVMPNAYRNETRSLLRSCLDGNNEFIQYCYTNYDINMLIKNILFDRKQEEKYLEITLSRYNLLSKLMEYDIHGISTYKNIIIYGAGTIGRAFYKKIKEKYLVKCFIDINRAGKKIEGIPVIWLNSLRNVENSCFLVTVTYDYSNICREIRKFFPLAIIKSLDEVINVRS